MVLEVLIATHGSEGIKRVAHMNLPRIPEVRYLVCIQQNDGIEIPEKLRRDDIRILDNPGIGLSNNRNFGIENSTGDIVLFADDDLRYLPQQLTSVLEVFRNNPKLDIATFRSDSPNGALYPVNPTKLKRRLPKRYWVTSYEIAARRSNLKELCFDERFGLGSGIYECGEEELFHLKAREKGYNCWFYPITIVTHDHLSTGTAHIKDKRVIKGFGAVIAKSFPLSWPLRLIIKAWRLRKGGQAPFIVSLMNLYIGAFESLLISI